MTREDVLSYWRELGEAAAMTDEELRRFAERIGKAFGDPTGGIRYGQDPLALAKPPYRRTA
jgi:hypothetical protein